MRYLVAVVFLFAATRGFAQPMPEFAPIGATWHYTIHEIWGEVHTAVCQSTGDAVIGGKPCRHITGAEELFVYRDSLQIFIYDSANTQPQWRLLYDFGKNVGDTFFVATPNWDNSGDDTIAVLVLAKGDTVINGFTLPYMVLASESVGLSNYGFEGKAIMNILHEYFFYPYGAWIDPAVGGLRCYEDSALGLYQLQSPCVYNWIGMDDASENATFDIFPNPSSNEITINFSNPHSETTVLQVLDVAGRQLHLPSTNENRILLPVDKLTNGVYWVKITGSNGSSSRLFTVNRQ